MNAVQLTGRMVRDAQVRTTKNGKEYAQFTIAAERAYKGADGKAQVDFINCKVWNGSAKFVSEYCPKGTVVAVQGELHIDRYTDRNGDSQTWVEVAASRVNKIADVQKKDTQEAGMADAWEDDAEEVDYAEAELPF